MNLYNANERRMAARRAATGMGWFSIALGMTELIAARGLCRWMGMRGQEDLIRFYGVRELATGIGLLTTKNPTPWMWGRVVGDGLDIATLAAQFEGNPRKGALMAALAAVAGATAVDVAAAKELSSPKALKDANRTPARDYSQRSGFPQGLEAARGAAAKDYPKQPKYSATFPQPTSLH